MSRDSDSDFDDFVSSRGPALLRTAYLLTGDRHLAEDLMQTALGEDLPPLVEGECRLSGGVRPTGDGAGEHLLVAASARC